jgi:hypothetical protein
MVVASRPGVKQPCPNSPIFLDKPSLRRRQSWPPRHLSAEPKHRDLVELIPLRPDIGLHIYRNPAGGTSEKLKRSGMPFAVK